MLKRPGTRSNSGQEQSCVCTWEKLYSCRLFRKAGKKEPRPAPSLASSSTAWLTLPLISLLLLMQNLRPPPHTHTHTLTRTLIFQLVNFTSRLAWECIGTTRHFSHCGKFQHRPFHVLVKLKQLLASKGFRVLGLCTVDLQTETIYEIEISRNTKSWHFCIASTSKIRWIYSYQSRKF